jgi:hypothetical protein
VSIFLWADFTGQIIVHRLAKAVETRKKGGNDMGWNTAGGLGMLLAGLGVFFWGLQFVMKEDWRRRKSTKRE